MLVGILLQMAYDLIVPKPLNLLVNGRYYPKIIHLSLDLFLLHHGNTSNR
jgi:hypothetical protein